jgi:hypothetical protein
MNSGTSFYAQSYGLSKVSSFYPLSPRRGEKVRVRWRDKKKLLAIAIIETGAGDQIG